MSILLFILVLSFLVIIHELGHFIAARWANVKVLEFGLGYPPKAFTAFTWRGTVFTVNWIPFGGFVKMAGEDVELEGNEKNTATELVAAAKAPGKELRMATTVQQLVIMLAGAAVNFLFGALVFAVVFTSNGIPQEITTARIGYVLPDSPAAEAGVPVDVEIQSLEIEGIFHPVSNPEEVIKVVEENLGKTVTLITTGPCNGLDCPEMAARYEVYARPVSDRPENEGAMGIAFNSIVYQRYSGLEMPIRSVLFGFHQAFELSGLIVVALQDLVTTIASQGQVPAELAGPVGIAHQAHDTGLLSQGFATLVSFAGLLSVNLAIMNILPIPPLDGGRVALTLLGLVLKKKHSELLEYYSSYAGYIALMGLIIMVTIRDVVQLFS